jgi:hypothetical protein
MPLNIMMIKFLHRRLQDSCVNFSFHLLDFIPDEFARKLGYFNPNLMFHQGVRLKKAKKIVHMIKQSRINMRLLEIAHNELQKQGFAKT